MTLTLPNVELAPPAASKASNAPELNVTFWSPVPAVIVPVPEVLLPARVCCGLEPVNVMPAAATSRVELAARTILAELAIEPPLPSFRVPALIMVSPL